jgi:CheY-like chemotaxis protein
MPRTSLHVDLLNMYFRVSRIAFWLAAAAAAWALLAARGQETLLMALTLIACVVAFFSWRAGVRAQRHLQALPDVIPEAQPLDAALLHEAAERLVQAVHAAASSDAALHAAAGVLRSELGALELRVCEVHQVDAGHARVADLLEAQPGFRTVPRRLRLEATPLGRALRTQKETLALPSAVLPVVVDAQVVAAIELRGISVPVDERALRGLLRLARLALTQRFATLRGAATGTDGGPDAALPALAFETSTRPAGRPESKRATRPNRSLDESPGEPPNGRVLVIDPDPATAAGVGVLARAGYHVTAVSGMLQAVAALRARQFDFVLLDERLSAVSGHPAAGRQGASLEAPLGELDTGTALLIALLAPGAPAEPTRLHEQGFDDHLSNPVEPAQMLALLKRHRQARAPAGAEPAAGGALAGRTPTDDAGVVVLDAGALARLSELDPLGQNQLLQRVLRAFQTSAARLRPQADAARKSGDRAALRLVAHTLKSSSASIGALRLSALCVQIESAIRLDDGTDLEPLLDAMGTALDATLLAIAGLLERGA